MEEQPVKRKRGRPKGSPNKNGTPVGRPKGSGRKQYKVEDANHNELVVKEPVTITPLKDGNTDASAVPNMIASCIQIRNGVDIENPATLFNAMEQYLGLCAMSGMKISNTMLYFACNVTRTVVYDWYHGRARKGNPEYKQFASMIKDICSAAREQYGLEGQVNPILTIFHQKYYDGFRDNPQIDDVVDPMGENQDPQKLAEKYKDIILD